MDSSKLHAIINIIREQMTATGGGLAGLPPQEPPVDLRKSKMRGWNPFFKDLARRKRKST
jgi:hypothetical protein